ncbi:MULTISPECIES: glycosyltransferase family 2 protein [unclassified Nitrospina]|uniref:glycosyltransferase family 2 protein n=1 Tax=unclassified Nitrospina TaxID=2638683 RepID=UPI003F98BE2A
MNESGATAVIIVNYNSGAYLKACLEALRAQSRPPNCVVIVDNASADGSAESAAHALPGAEWIHLDTNTGFAAANNLAVRRAADCRWVALLNPDTVPDPDWLAALHRAAVQYPDFTFFASHLVQYDDPQKLDGTGDVLHVSGFAWRRDHGHPALHRPRATGEVFAACAAAAMYDRQAFLDAGAFDEDYFAYHEDVDLAFRLRLRGHRCLYAADATVAHAGWGSTAKDSAFSTYHGHRNMVWTFFKNMPAPLLWKYLPSHLFYNALIVVWFMLKGRGGLICKAKWHALRGLPRALRQRRAIQRAVCVPQDQIADGLCKAFMAPANRFRKE